MKLWGGLQGNAPYRIGQIEVEYVVEAAGTSGATWTPQSPDIDQIRRHVERDRLAAGLRRQPGWWVDPWTFERIDRFDREAVRWVLYRRVSRGLVMDDTFEPVGHVILTWPSAEDLEGVA